VVALLLVQVVMLLLVVILILAVEAEVLAMPQELVIQVDILVGVALVQVEVERGLDRTEVLGEIQ